MPSQLYPVSKLVNVKRVLVAIKICENGHGRAVFRKAVDGNIDGVAVEGFDLTHIDGGRNGPRTRSRVNEDARCHHSADVFSTGCVHRVRSYAIRTLMTKEN